MVTKVFVLDEACLIAEIGILNHISYLFLFLICHRTMTGVILPRLEC